MDTSTAVDVARGDLTQAWSGWLKQRRSGWRVNTPHTFSKEEISLANHDDTSQQEALDSSTEGALSGERAAEQEERRHAGQSESEQGHQGMVAASEAAHEHMSPQESGVMQGEVGSPPQEALEPGSPTMDHQGDQTPGSAPEELPEREVVPVPAARLEAEGEQPLNQQAR